MLPPNAALAAPAKSRRSRKPAARPAECAGCGQVNPSGGVDPDGNQLCINCYSTNYFICGLCKRDLGLDALGCPTKLHCQECCTGIQQELES